MFSTLEKRHLKFMHFKGELNIPWIMLNIHENLETFSFKFKILSTHFYRANEK